MRKADGRAWVYGDKVDSDLLAPGLYMKQSLAELARHCLEAIDPHFARDVQPGDVVVGGEAFGIGSSREQAAEALVHLGVGAVIAKSFARIFYRNALNLGLPVLVSPDVGRISAGDHLVVDAREGRIANKTTGEVFHCDKLPDFLLAMVEDGGLMPHLEKSLRAGSAREDSAKIVKVSTE